MIIERFRRLTVLPAVGRLQAESTILKDGPFDKVVNPI